jgi:electron-transferring-flavoprotein dehydrogenase
MEVCLIEKGSHIGAHILSGNVFEPRALNELFPNWKELGVSLFNSLIYIYKYLNIIF